MSNYLGKVNWYSTRHYGANVIDDVESYTTIIGNPAHKLLGRNKSRKNIEILKLDEILFL